MFSVVLRPQIPLHQLGTMSILAGAAIAHAVEEQCGVIPEIKWPNDVLIGGKKVSGILMQTRQHPEPVAVLGCGINMRFPEDQLPDHALSLEEVAAGPIDIDSFFACVISELQLAYAMCHRGLSPSEIDHLDAHLWSRGKLVSIQDADRITTGTLLGLSENGGLRMLVNGLETVVVAGELTRGPRPI